MSHSASGFADYSDKCGALGYKMDKAERLLQFTDLRANAARQQYPV